MSAVLAKSRPVYKLYNVIALGVSFYMVYDPKSFLSHCQFDVAELSKSAAAWFFIVFFLRLFAALQVGLVFVLLRFHMFEDDQDTFKKAHSAVFLQHLARSVIAYKTLKASAFVPVNLYWQWSLFEFFLCCLAWWTQEVDGGPKTPQKTLD